MLKKIINLLRLVNLSHYYFFKFKEKFYSVPPWAGELSRYFKTTPEKIIIAYQQKKIQTIKLWDRIHRCQLKQIFSFYSETDYFVYRQAHFNRLNSWYDIALPMLLKQKGRLCEYGAGIDPITNWLIRLFPNWQYNLVDLNCPASKFSQWRFKNYPHVTFATVKSLHPPLKGKFDIIVCRQVMEHVPNPLTICQKFVEHLKSGGWLFIDFIDSPGGENLSSSYQERTKVLSYLKTKLKPVFTIYSNGKDAGYGLYVR